MPRLTPITLDAQVERIIASEPAGDCIEGRADAAFASSGDAMSKLAEGASESLGRISAAINRNAKETARTNALLLRLIAASSSAPAANDRPVRLLRIDGSAIWVAPSAVANIDAEVTGVIIELRGERPGQIEAIERLAGTVDEVAGVLGFLPAAEVKHGPLGETGSNGVQHEHLAGAPVASGRASSSDSAAGHRRQDALDEVTQ